jgi:hypothetical protein
VGVSANLAADSGGTGAVSASQSAIVWALMAIFSASSVPPGIYHRIFKRFQGVICFDLDYFILSKSKA